MSDDALHPDDETASAYLDGELEQDERARAEASPTTIGRSRTFAVVHDRLADVPPAAATARDDAVAAALAEFDSLHAPVVAAAMAAPPAPAIPLFRRNGFRILGAAAAVLLVGVVGVAVLNSGQSDDNNSSASPGADRQMESTADTATATEFAADDAAGGAPSEVLSATTIGSITGPAQAPPQVSSELELLALADAWKSTDGAEGDATADSTPADVTVTTKAPQTPQPASTTAATRVAAACPLEPSQTYVTDIIWIDTPAALIVDTDPAEVLAIGADCTVLARATR